MANSKSEDVVDLSKEFTVFHFSEDNGVEVVPSSWISEDHKFARFPGVLPDGFCSIQERGNKSKPDKSWPNWAGKCIKSYSERI